MWNAMRRESLNSRRTLATKEAESRGGEAWQANQGRRHQGPAQAPPGQQWRRCLWESGSMVNPRAADQANLLPILVGHNPPAVVLLLIDPAGSVEGLWSQF